MIDILGYTLTPSAGRTPDQRQIRLGLREGRHQTCLMRHRTCARMRTIYAHVIAHTSRLTCARAHHTHTYHRTCQPHMHTCQPYHCKDALVRTYRSDAPFACRPQAHTQIICTRILHSCMGSSCTLAWEVHTHLHGKCMHS